MKLRHVLVLLAILVFIVGCKPAEQPPVAPAAPEQPPAAPEQPPAAPEQLPAPTERPEGGVEAQVGTYAVTKETGVILGVGCDFGKDIFFFRVTNPSDKTVEFYKKVIPSQKNYLKFALSGMTLSELDCGGKTALEPRETVECSKSGVTFRSKISELEDRLSAVMVGNHDALSFRCEEGNVKGRTTEASATDVGAAETIVGDAKVAE